MLKYKNKLNRLNDRALTILETGQVLWVTPETESPLLIDLNNEFTFIGLHAPPRSLSRSRD